MVQIAVAAERSPVMSPALHIDEDAGAGTAAATAAGPRTYTGDVYRTESRMSVEGNNSEEEDSGFRGRSSSDTKTSSSDMSVQLRSTDSASPKSEGFSSSPMSLSGDDQTNMSINRVRAVLDLSMPSAFSRKSKDHARQPERRSSFSNALVPPYSPFSSSAGSLSSSSSGSPSVTPEVKMDEVSIHYIAALAKDAHDQRSHRVPLPPASGSEFDLPKNFYGYYVYQMELASRYNARNGSSLPQPPAGSVRNTTPPLVGKVKPTVKTESRDDEIVSYGSLLEQALRNGLKRSPSDAASHHADKKAKLAASAAVTAASSPQPATPPPPQQQQQQHQTSSVNGGPAAHAPAASRSSSNGQVSVEDVAKTSLRELLHNKQMQDAKVAAMAQIQQQYHSGNPDSRNGSRSSSPSVNLKTLLETQTREALKCQIGQHRSSSSDMASVPFPAASSRQASQQQNFQSGKHHPNQPMLYPHILNRSTSPVMRERSASDAHMRSAHSPVHLAGLFKHKKLLEWTAADVRDWVSTLNYCSEFSDIFLQQSVDGVALTLLNETHLMKNFGMKLGPAIKLRCAVWEILGLCQAAAPLPQMPMSMPHFIAQKQIPVGHCIPQHHGGVLPKQ